MLILYCGPETVFVLSNYIIVVSVTLGVGQVVLERAVAVVAVEEAEIGLAAREIHNYSVRSLFGSGSRRKMTEFAARSYVCEPRYLISGLLAVIQSTRPT